MLDDLDAFEPTEKMRPIYESLLASFQIWGSFRAPEILSDSRIRLGPAAQFEELAEVHRYLGHSPPLVLDRFWQVANGLRFDVHSVIFSTRECIEENKRMRSITTSYCSFEGLFFISSLGDGDMFAMRRTMDGKWLDSVLIWEHETDRRYEIAESLQDYVAKLLVWWLDSPGD
jgi:hypothetical protein